MESFTYLRNEGNEDKKTNPGHSKLALCIPYHYVISSLYPTDISNDKNRIQTIEYCRLHALPVLILTTIWFKPYDRISSTYESISSSIIMNKLFIPMTINKSSITIH